MPAGLSAALARCALATSVSTPSLYRGASALGRKYENARLTRAPEDGALELTLDFKSTDFATGRSRTLRSFYRLGADGTCTRALTHDVTVDPAVRICVPSPDGRLQLRVCTEPAGNGGATSGDDVLEIWAGSDLLRRRSLAGKVGAVYSDGVFGEPVFSPDGRAIVMLAERLVPRQFASYFDDDDEGVRVAEGAEGAGTGVPSGDGTGGVQRSAPSGKGPAAAKFRPRPDFGERLGGKVEPVLIVYCLEHDELLLFDNQPGEGPRGRGAGGAEQGAGGAARAKGGAGARPHLGLRPCEHPAHPRFDATGQGLLFSAYDLAGFKHGLSACLNRPTRSFIIPSFRDAAAAAAAAAAPAAAGGGGSAAMGAAAEGAGGAAAAAPAVEAGTAGAQAGRAGAGSAAFCLSPSSFLALRPLPTPDGSAAIVLHRADPFREHSACFELRLLPLPAAPAAGASAEGAEPARAEAAGSEARTLVGLVSARSPESGAESAGAPDAFHGVYGFHDDVLSYAFLRPRLRAQQPQTQTQTQTQAAQAGGEGEGGARGDSALIFQTLVAGEAAVFVLPLAPGGQPSAQQPAPMRLRHPSAAAWARGSASLLCCLDDTAVVRLSAVDKAPEVYAVSGLLGPRAAQRWALVASAEQQTSTAQPQQQLPQPAALARAPAPPFRLAAPRDAASSAALGALRAGMRGVRAATVRVASGAEALLLVPACASPPLHPAAAAAGSSADGGGGGGGGGGAAGVPLVVLLHGGPHSAALDAFEPRQAMLLARGCALLLPNYRGSLSYGEAFVRALAGRAGELDVDDCAELTRAALASELGAACLDAARVCAFGGSHGGFLAGWLAGHPVHRSLFCAAVLWNPVIDVGAMLGATDIPEWCAAEGLGREWRFGGQGGVWPLSGADMAALHAASPISVVHNVECAALLVLGGADRRVPPMNGRQWAAALEARGRQCEVHEYPDEGHALGGAEATAHVSVTIVDWICGQLFGTAEPGQHEQSALVSR